MTGDDPSYDPTRRTELVRRWEAKALTLEEAYELRDYLLEDLEWVEAKVARSEADPEEIDFTERAIAYLTALIMRKEGIRDLRAAT